MLTETQQGTASDLLVESWRDVALAQHPVTGMVQGKLTRDGNGAQVLGDPRVALTWRVNELSGLGTVLKAGQVVTTGTCLQPLQIVAGDQVRAAFGALGEVTLSVGP